MVEKKIEKKSLLAGSVVFLCPKCGETKIVRSYHEREIATKYVCGSCGFEGPN
ncbi:MAG: zinc finger domain-containing protein [Candidatus Woesearchaeota archaeon]